MTVIRIVPKETWFELRAIAKATQKADAKKTGNKSGNK